MRIWVCPVPGCATIGKSATAGCPKHPTRALVKEVYAHQRSSNDTDEQLAKLFAQMGKEWPK
jgi:hypothetical protein